MGTAELNNTKKELVGWIQSLTDDSILSLLSSVKLSSEGKSADWWEELTESDRDNILSGIKDYQQGETMKSKEFWEGLTNG
ncbi:hypothetical protein DHD32_14510 [Arenibacter sp. TNZ]|jgi:hypothetical protein|uniref:hypothetical protein n=1 Tax=Arenibacter TaxID=178469 RepID=UPI000CD3E83B|nr:MULTISPECIES: hypothetical protein [Arenibacter]MCM4172701.1 hypothetical protein [Arenibacter sp. TNZ]